MLPTPAPPPQPPKRKQTTTSLAPAKKKTKKAMRAEALLDCPLPPVESMVREDWGPSMNGPGIRKPHAQILEELESDEELVESDRSFGIGDIQHYVRFHFPRNQGIYSSSNQVLNETDYVRQLIYEYVQYFRHSCWMMSHLRQCHLVLPSGSTVHSWLHRDRDLPTPEQQMEIWVEPFVKDILANQDDKKKFLHTIHQTLVAWWMTQEQYNVYMEQLRVRPPVADDNEEAEDVAPWPTQLIYLSLSPVRTGVTYLGEWHNQVLPMLKSPTDRPALFIHILVQTCSKSLEPARVKRLTLYQDKFFKTYNCPLVFLPCFHVSTRLDQARLTPEYRKLDRDNLSPPLKKIVDKAFRPMKSTDPLALLHDWRPGDLIQAKSRIMSTQPIYDFSEVVFKSSLYGMPGFILQDQGALVVTTVVDEEEEEDDVGF